MRKKRYFIVFYVFTPQLSVGLINMTNIKATKHDLNFTTNTYYTYISNHTSKAPKIETTPKSATPWTFRSEYRYRSPYKLSDREDR